MTTSPRPWYIKKVEGEPYLFSSNHDWVGEVWIAKPEDLELIVNAVNDYFPISAAAKDKILQEAIADKNQRIAELEEALKECLVHSAFDGRRRKRLVKVLNGDD